MLMMKLIRIIILFQLINIYICGIFDIGPTKLDPKLLENTNQQQQQGKSNRLLKILNIFQNHATNSLKELQSSSTPILVEQTTSSTTKSSKNNDEYPYWRFIPFDIGLVKPSSTQPVTWTGMCFKKSSAISKLNEDGSVDLILTLSDAEHLFCSDIFLMGTVSEYSIRQVFQKGDTTIKWSIPLGASPAVKWDLQTNGIRLFMFKEDWSGIFLSIITTANLFDPMSTRAVSERSANENIKFLQNYPKMIMKKRAQVDVPLNKSDIFSGDVFASLRLDGLDPMLAWGMGSTTAHMAIALWGDDGELYICESTATTSYWDENGIQKTPYDKWLTNTKSASINVIHLPLDPIRRTTFNTTLAWNFFKTTEGLDYGFSNILWSWVDTIKDNYPCAPPEYDRCLTFNLITVIFPQIEPFLVEVKEFYEQSWNHRLGTSGLSLAEILFEASKQNISADSLPSIVEDDSWNYNILRNGTLSSGPSMVCSSFVCRIWKEGRLFGNLSSEINCSEFTNWDITSLAVFDSNYVRPEACVAADPESRFCQLLGEYTLDIKDYNSKAPFAHMAEKCPSLAPNYAKPADC